MNLIAEIIISALIIVGGFFLFVGSFGLAKLPDLFRRLHAPTKATTLGIGSLLIASMLFFLIERGTLSFHELLISIFLFLTAPISANMIAKAQLLRDKRAQRELPPARRSGWATIAPRPGKVRGR
jgi:multicomponent K+:H+ antiporter subunit G